jgi:hypothetical protein
MGPFDYRTNVLDPITMALQGYAARVAEGQATRQLDQADTRIGQDQQRIDMAGQAMAFEQQQAAMAAQQQAQAKAQAEAAQSAYVDYILDPAKDAAKTEAVIRANPQLADAVMGVWQGLNEDQKGNTLQFGKQVVYALKSGNVDAAKRLLDERIEAAENAGNKAEADAYRAEKMQIEAGGADGVLADAMVTLFGGMNPKEFDEFAKSLPGAAADEPAAIQTLRIRAKEAGLAEGTPEYAAFMMKGGEPDNGMVIESDGQGGFRMVQGTGAGAAAAKPFTEAQSKDVIFATRAKGALEALEPVVDALTSRMGRAAEMDPTGLTRGMQSDEFQVAWNAGNEFLQAILRKDTGAAITADEQSLYGETYLPKPGDNSAVLAQKAEARKRAIAAIEAGMSPAQMVAQEKALRNNAPIASWADAMALDDAGFMGALEGLARQGIAPTAEARARYARIKGGGQ